MIKMKIISTLKDGLYATHPWSGWTAMVASLSQLWGEGGKCWSRESTRMKLLCVVCLFGLEDGPLRYSVLVQEHRPYLGIG